jgi:hypothetical protein
VYPVEWTGFSSPNAPVAHAPVYQIVNARHGTVPSASEPPARPCPVQSRRVWLPALRALRIRPCSFYNSRHTYVSTLLDAGAKPLFVCRQTGTSLEMIEKHYGDARVDAEQLDEMIGEFESTTGNLPGTLPDASDDSLPSKVKEPFVFYGFQRERATGVEPATSSLGSWHSTTELRPRSGRNLPQPTPPGNPRPSLTAASPSE